MSPHNPPFFPRHPLSTAIQAAITATALSLPLWVQAEPPPPGTNLGTLWVGGYSSQGGDANGNSLALQGTPLPGATNAIAGGFSYVCSDNTNGCPEGEAAKGNANNNTLTLNAGDYGGIQEVRGGGVADGTGSANGNTLVLDGMSNSTQIQAFGGIAGNDYSEAGSTSDNKVIMHSGEVGSVIGGDGDAGSTGNTVEIHGGTVAGKHLDDDPSQPLVGVAGGSSWRGDATGNSVLIQGDSQISGSVFGGASEDGNANGNSVQIKGNTAVTNSEIIGGMSWNGSANNNTVEIHNIQSDAWVAGGAAWAEEGSATGNTVTMHDGEVKAITGGAAAGDASNNTVAIHGGTITDVGSYATYSSVTGGEAWGEGNANNNSVLIEGDTTVVGNIAGGFSTQGNANGNTVTLKGGNLADVEKIYGGWVLDGNSNANNNTVEISNIQSNAIVIGGAVDGNLTGNGSASDNTVTLHSGQVATLIGGYTDFGNDAGNATGNTVTVHGGTITGSVQDGGGYGDFLSVVGGYANGANSEGGIADSSANNNTVLIDGNATISGDVSGGLTAKGHASGNQVTIDGASFTGKAYDTDYDREAEVHGGRVVAGKGSANDNTVEIHDMQGSGNTWVVGGLIDSGSGNAGNADGNTVIVHSGTGLTAVTGGHTSHGNARNNQVVINGGTMSAVIGGEAYSGKPQENIGTNGISQVSGNTVVIRGGTIDMFVAGGALEVEEIEGFPITSTATRNTVTIEGNAANLSKAGLFGGIAHNGQGNPVSTTGDLFTGNTLNLEGVNGLAVQEVGNFEFLNFALPESTQSGDTILKVAGTADIRGSTLGVRVLGSDPVLEVGDTVNLIEAGELKADEVIKTRGLQGSTIQYTFDTQQNGNTLTSAVTQRGATESSKSLSEGFVAGAAALTAAADFSASQGTAAAVGAVAGAGGSAGGQSFGTTGGGSIRNNTGSHVDVRSFNLVAGLAKGFKQANGELTVGGFFEYGDGNYSSYNDFTSGEVRGSGKTRSYGVGVLGHYALDSGVYVEASLRTGRAEQDYSSDALGSYDSKTHYVGSHIGAGKVWALNDSLGLDTYAHYVWQRQSGDTVKLSTGETLAFEAVTSQRVRLGARLTKGLNETFSAYVGAGYENELDGKARATTNGVPMDSPSMKGDSGLVELGLNVRPLKNKALMLGVGVQGYFGQKEGVTGTLQLGYKF